MYISHAPKTCALNTIFPIHKISDFSQGRIIFRWFKTLDYVCLCLMLMDAKFNYLILLLVEPWKRSLLLDKI
jgi:hypothetical protein